MKSGLLSVILCAAAFVATPALAQRTSPAAQLGLYTPPVGPSERPERDWQDFRKYDFDRLEAGQTAYYANRYYRDWRYYKAHALERGDRIYRGGDMQYYCRRADGTTGEIEGLSGHMNSGRLSRGESKLIADLIDTGESGLGQQVNSGKLICR